MSRMHWGKKQSKKHPDCYLGPPNDPVCHNLSFLRAKESPFHDQVLIEATQNMNETFRGLREQAPAGTHLALIDTGPDLGLLLIWAEKATKPPGKRAVTYRSPEEKIRKALGLVDEDGSAAKGAASAGA